MHYTKIALLIFGAGMIWGLVVIAFELDEVERIASALMAFGIAAIPVALIVDWRLAGRSPTRGPVRGRPKPRTRRPAAAPRRRPRKSAAGKR